MPTTTNISEKKRNESENRTIFTYSIKIWITIGAISAYIIAFLILSPIVSSEAAALTPLPVIVVGGFWGLRAGVLAGILGIPLNIFLMFITNQPDWNLLTHPQYLTGAAGAIIIGAITGYMQGLRERLRNELSARTRAEQDLLKSERQYRALMETAPDVIYHITTDGRIASLNPAFEKITGWPIKEVIGRPFTDLLHPDDVPAAIKGFELVIKHGDIPPPVELRVISKSGEYLTGEFSSAPVIENGVVTGEFGMARDITERKRIEEKLRHIAYYDALTGLPNRELFNDRLRQALMHARRYKTRLAVMFLDLDRFKGINDTLGHRMGDLLLQAVPERLGRCVRISDTVARLGGDEFIISFPDVAHAQDAAHIAQKIIKAFAGGFMVGGQELFITASIGISMYPLDGADVDTLIKNADVAMYQAKAQGRNNCQFYTPAMNEEALRKLILENNLRKALEREEFLLHYQPLIELTTGRITGAEALLRWRHPGLGLLEPAEFIPMAEETGLIVPIGEWMLRKACAQNKLWQKAGFSPFRMSVNLSMRQFKHDAVAESVSGALDGTGLAPDDLELEITESVVMQNASQTISTLRDLKAIGLHLSIDDFGTGYSSLSYLKDLPLSRLKLDLSFVSALTKDAGNKAISSAIISLAHNLNLRVTAEGVETADQLEILRSLKCDEVQGYLFSRPLPADDMARFMADVWN